MKLTDLQLNQILEKAIWAPSGDNCQPWTFEWDGKTLKIFHNAQRALHPLNANGISSLISLGCLVESIYLAASEFGCIADWIFQDFDTLGISQWAAISFSFVVQKKNPLADLLLSRTTDRNFFRCGMLNADMLQQMDRKPTQLHILSNPPKELLDYIVEAEQLLVELPGLLPSTMKWARLSFKEAQKSGDGLSWRNLGAQIWEIPMMPLIRDFPKILKLAKYVIGPQHRSRVKQQLQSSAGLICVSAPVKNRENIVVAGSLMMNAWLSLTGHGYGVQPLTIASTICMKSKENIMPLPNKWTQFFDEGEKILRKSFSIPSGSMPVWMIRAGLSTALPEKSRTFRKPLNEIFTNMNLKK